MATDLLLTSPHAAANQAIGRAQGEAESVLLVLKARGFTPTEAQRTQIMSCTDLTQLQTWVTDAVTVASVDDLFE